MSGLILLLVGLALYFVPFLVALGRKHHNTGAIFVFNLFLGWTFLGWIWALTWACSYTSRPHLADQSGASETVSAGSSKAPAGPWAKEGFTIAFAVISVLIFLVAVLYRKPTRSDSVNLPSSEPATFKTVATIAETPSGPSNDEEIRRANDKALAKLGVLPISNSSPSASPSATPTEYLSAEAWNGSDFQVTKRTWEKGGFGVIGIWRVTIKNLTDRPIGDFRYTTNYESETGVNHGSHSGQLEKRLEAGQVRIFEINDGFVSSQSDKGGIDFKKAAFLGGHAAKSHKPH
jgi:T4 superinfection immunity protein